jgi:type II secretion system protein G
MYLHVDILFLSVNMVMQVLFNEIAMYKKKTRGFTLIELLVVIAIIGILSAIVMASLNVSRRKSRDARRISDIKQLQLALELYFDSHGFYPTDPTNSQTLEDSDLDDEGFIIPIPADPDGSQYLYAHIPDVNPINYHLATFLEDTNHTLVVGGCDSSSPGGCFVNAATNGFDGTSVGVYDVTP